MPWPWLSPWVVCALVLCLLQRELTGLLVSLSLISECMRKFSGLSKLLHECFVFKFVICAFLVWNVHCLESFKPWLPPSYQVLDVEKVRRLPLPVFWYAFFLAEVLMLWAIQGQLVLNDFCFLFKYLFWYLRHFRDAVIRHFPRCSSSRNKKSPEVNLYLLVLQIIHIF